MANGQQLNKTIGVVFESEVAREAAYTALQQQVGMRAYIVAPEALAPREWIEVATDHCSDWRVRYVYDQNRYNLMGILAVVDELHVIANTPSWQAGGDLALSEFAQDLLWLALHLGVKAKCYGVDGAEWINFADYLLHTHASDRVSAEVTWRTQFTQKLQEIRLGCDLYSSGLWGKDGAEIGYDLVNLPLKLVCRIAAWQRDYDVSTDPPLDMGSDAWQERHDEEGFKIALELQAVLGAGTLVKLLGNKQGWMPLSEVIRAKQEEAKQGGL